MSTLDRLTEEWPFSRRTGIERGDGVTLALPSYFVVLHEHYCASHDHRWRCCADPCIRHEATPCGAS